MRHRQLKKWDTATWNMQTQPTLSTRTHWESRHLLWGDVAHSGMGLHLAWLLDRRKQPQIWGKEWKGKHVYINTCFNTYIKTSLLWGVHLSIYFFEVVCLLVDMSGSRTTHIWVEFFKKTSVHPFVGYHLLHPWYLFPHIILLGYRFHIFLNPLATTLTSLFPFYAPFTYCWTLWLPLLHPFSPTTPLLHIFEPFGYHSYIPFPLLHPFYILLNPSPKGWHYSIFAWQEPYLLEPNITLRNLMTNLSY